MPLRGPSPCAEGQQGRRFGFGIMNRPLCSAPSSVLSNFQLCAQKCDHLPPTPPTHTFLEWPFLTDFKKYTHSPPPPPAEGTIFWRIGPKHPPSWHIMDSPREICIHVCLRVFMSPMYGGVWHKASV